MISSLALSDTMLAFASIFSVSLMAQQKSMAQVHRLSSIMALLGFSLVALAACLGSLRYGISSRWAVSHDIMTNIATFISPPLISTALCLGLCAKTWNKLAWGGFIIVLWLLYDLSHWYKVDTLYRNVQLTLSLVICLFFILKSNLNYSSKLIGLTAITSYFIAGLIIAFNDSFFACLRLELFQYFLGLGNLLLSSNIYLALKNNYMQPILTLN